MPFNSNVRLTREKDIRYGTSLKNSTDNLHTAMPLNKCQILSAVCSVEPLHPICPNGSEEQWEISPEITMWECRQDKTLLHVFIYLFWIASLNCRGVRTTYVAHSSILFFLKERKKKNAALFHAVLSILVCACKRKKERQMRVVLLHMAVWQAQGFKDTYADVRYVKYSIRTSWNCLFLQGRLKQLIMNWRQYLCLLLSGTGLLVCLRECVQDKTWNHEGLPFGE